MKELGALPIPLSRTASSELCFPVHGGAIAIRWNRRIEEVRWVGRDAVEADGAPSVPVLPDLDQEPDLVWGRISLGRSPGGVPASVLDLRERLIAYFRSGEPLGGIPWDELENDTWTSFQASVFGAISRIPFGETRTYGWVAQQVGNFAASRAVGQALRGNPLPILIPCHRVTAVTSLGGFMGTTSDDSPEIRLKRKLLSLEDTYRNPLFPFLTAG